MKSCTLQYLSCSSKVRTTQSGNPVQTLQRAPQLSLYIFRNMSLCFFTFKHYFSQIVTILDLSSRKQWWGTRMKKRCRKLPAFSYSKHAPPLPVPSIVSPSNVSSLHFLLLIVEFCLTPVTAVRSSQWNKKKPNPNTPQHSMHKN